MRARLGYYSLGFGWIWTEICGPGCTLAPVTAPLSTLQTTLLTVLLVRQQQLAWNVHSEQRVGWQ